MSQPEAAPAGVIHDIGYRGYQGVRQGRGSIRLALFTHSLRGVYGLGRSGKSKIIPFGVVAVMLLPAVIVAAVAVFQANAGLLSEPLVPYTRYASILSAALTIFVAVTAPQAVSLDMRYATLPLYLSRPLTRGDYVMAKFAALTTGVFILLAGPILVLYIGALLADFPAGTASVDAGLALVGAVFFAVVLSGFALVIASLTPRRGFGIAAIITVLTLSYTIVSALQGIFGEGFGDERLAGWIGLFSPITLVDGVQVWAFGVESSAVFGPPAGGGLVFLLIMFVFVAACYAAMFARYRKVKL
jgi:ABC-2 type transport system permease protein